MSPAQLVLIGVGQGIVSLVFKIPAGIMAVTISRKWSLVIFHLLVGSSMIATGLVTAFPALLATQMLWGIAWTFASGADIAWFTDELKPSQRTATVLVAHARWQQIGAASGRLLFGALAWATTRSTAMVLDGSMMALLGLYVVTRCAEHHFTLTRTHQWRQAMTLLRRGVTLARHDHGVLVMFAATFLINRSWGCVRAVVCQTPPWPRRATRRRSNRVVHRARIVAFAVGALALRRVEARIAGAGLTRRVYAVACGIGTLGVLLLAAAPDVVSGSAGVLMVTGIAWTVTCAVAAIWVNRRTTSEVRATVHSFLAQMEYGGEIVCGAVLSVLAQATSITGALVGACALVAGAGMVVKVGPFVKTTNRRK